jgi:hypothetical protein
MKVKLIRHNSFEEMQKSEVQIVSISSKQHSGKKLKKMIHFFKTHIIKK